VGVPKRRRAAARAAALGSRCVLVVVFAIVVFVGVVATGPVIMNSSTLVAVVLEKKLINCTYSWKEPTLKIDT
jgi:hypothetical protein